MIPIIKLRWDVLAEIIDLLEKKGDKINDWEDGECTNCGGKFTKKEDMRCIGSAHAVFCVSCIEDLLELLFN